MSHTEQVAQLKQDAHAIYSNIEWNLGCCVDMGVVILNPKLLNLQVIPLRIDVDGRSLDGCQCLGIDLLEKERQARANEVLGAVRRALLCAGVELAADFLVRTHPVVPQRADPYE